MHLMYMEAIIKLASDLKFVRHSSRLDLPIVFHCVPGAGKTTAIRELINKDSRFVAYTAGIADTPGLSGAWIRKYEGSFPSDKLVILDEYTQLEQVPGGLFAVFGDPVQSSTRCCLRAHFTCNISRRFGKATASLLRELGFDVVSEQEDLVQILDVFSAELAGTVVYFEEEVGCLLKRHSVEALHVRDIQGATFEQVTFVTGENTPQIDRVSAFQCLTRHKRALQILCPGATYSSN